MSLTGESTMHIGELSTGTNGRRTKTKDDSAIMTAGNHAP
jgi:hypothetical protein